MDERVVENVPLAVTVGEFDAVRVTDAVPVLVTDAVIVKDGVLEGVDV